MLPSLGSVGAYTFTSPFNQIVLGDEFTCQSIRSISEMVQAGIDVYNTIYAANSLTTANYQADIGNDVHIVTLSCSNGVWVNIPDSYITSPPNSDGVTYVVTVIGASLGAIPANTDLTAVMASITNVITDMYGVVPTLKVLEVSRPKIESVANDAIIQRNRLAVISTSVTDSAKATELQTMYNKLLIQFNDLQTFVLANKDKLGL